MMTVTTSSSPRLRRESLDASSPVPLYYQLQEVLEHAIEAGNLAPDDALPTEKELGDSYRVSRTTVRQAIEGLVRQGLVVKRQGKGSFVARRKVHEELPKLTSFTEEMRARDLNLSTRVLSVQQISAPSHIAALLSLEPNESVLKIRRLRHVENVPILITTSYLPGRLGVSAHDDFSGSLYTLLEGRYGVRIASGQNTIEASVASKPEAVLLGVKPRSPLLTIHRLTFDADGMPVEYVEGIYRGDRYQYVVQLRR